MQNKKVLILIIVAVGAFSLFLLRPKGERKARQHASTSGQKNNTGKKILYYQAPMNPSYISEKPGKSPMGMDLIPVYEGEETPEGAVKIDPTTVQNIGVRTEIVYKRVLKREIRTVGRVTFDEKKVAYINTKVGGWIEKLYIDYEGQEVKKDDPLLEIYSPELVSTQQEYLLALEYNKKIQEGNIQEINERSKTLVGSARKRLEYWDVPEIHIGELEQTGEVRKTLMIHSPISGVVIHKTALEGKYTKPGENLYRIADLSTIWVYGDIYEYELPWVKVGQEAQMSLSYLPGKVFRGKITYVYPTLESKTRTAKVRLEFDNKDGELKPDMYADVSINTAPSKAVVSVPKEAVIHSGKRNVIIVDKGKGLFEPKDVLIGMQTKDFYEVLHGLKEGEHVVTSAQFLIDSESQLNEAINKMLKAKKSGSMTMKGEMKGSMKNMPAMAVSESTREAMNDIWESYFYLRKELTKDSIANFDVEAQLVREKANFILNSRENSAVKSIARNIMKSTQGLQEKDIVKIREGFLTLSNAMIDYMKNYTLDASKKKGFQLFYCGMEKKYWVQKENKVGNPYVSASISYCGAPDIY